MLNVPVDKVVIRTYAGSGHYGRSNGGNAGAEDEAVLLSKAVGRPVRVQWMRAEDVQWSTRSSALASDIKIGLDQNGRVLSYQSDHFGPPMQDDRLVGALLAGLPTMGVPAPKMPAPHQGELLVRDPWVYHNVPNVAEVGHGTPQIGQHESPLQAGLRDHSMRTPIQFQQNFPREVATVARRKRGQRGEHGHSGTRAVGSNQAMSRVSRHRRSLVRSVARMRGVHPCIPLARRRPAWPWGPIVKDYVDEMDPVSCRAV